jgi:DNA mismatch endonuclease (patch repair protein)
MSATKARTEVDPARSRQMALIRSADTKPEMKVRRALHAMGYRYRLHRRDLPGTPDLVFPGRKTVVFVHGCFWHRHPDPDCRLARLPKSRRDFWIPKLTRNAERDAEAIAALEAAGWRVMVIWECQTRDMGDVGRRLSGFLGPARGGRGIIEPPGDA